VALRDTIRLMGEIDEIIRSWPTQGRPTGMCEQCFRVRAGSP